MLMVEEELLVIIEELLLYRVDTLIAEKLKKRLNYYN